MAAVARRTLLRAASGWTWWPCASYLIHELFFFFLRKRLFEYCHFLCSASVLLETLQLDLGPSI
uniref:Uncharacterized protein n=1 Tax=Arundo donax TaxID=35708 RepID=A0A0A9A8N9_ARUDO